MKNYLKHFLFFVLLYQIGMAQNNFFDIEIKDIDGKILKLEKFKGKTILIVNVASKCGYTYQYEGLEKLYQKFKNNDFVILAFPSNDFLWQEPGTEKEILEFCTNNYGVSFPIFSKIEVWGNGQHPLYKYLTDVKTNPNFSGRITWNFNKFLIDKNGKIINRFTSKTEPESKIIIEAISDIL